MLLLNKKFIKNVTSSFFWFLTSFGFSYVKINIFSYILFSLGILFGAIAYIEYRKHKKINLENIKNVQKEELIQEFVQKEKESIESLNFFHQKQ